MTTTQTLISERLADLAEETPGNVRATVDHLLDAAWDAVWERQDRDADGLTTALAHVDAALATLTQYRERLAALHEQDSAEYLAEFVAAKREGTGQP